MLWNETFVSVAALWEPKHSCFSDLFQLCLNCVVIHWSISWVYCACLTVNLSLPQPFHFCFIGASLFFAQIDLDLWLNKRDTTVSIHSKKFACISASETKNKHFDCAGLKLSCCTSVIFNGESCKVQSQAFLPPICETAMSKHCIFHSTVETVFIKGLMNPFVKWCSMLSVFWSIVMTSQIIFSMFALTKLNFGYWTFHTNHSQLTIQSHLESQCILERLLRNQKWEQETFLSVTKVKQN